MAFLSRISILSSRRDTRASRVDVTIVGCLALGVVAKGPSRQQRGEMRADPTLRTGRHARGAPNSRPPFTPKDHVRKSTIHKKRISAKMASNYEAGL